MKILWTTISNQLNTDIIEKFPEKYDVPKLSQKECLNSLITISEIELI